MAPVTTPGTLIARTAPATRILSNIASLRRFQNANSPSKKSPWLSRLECKRYRMQRSRGSSSSVRLGSPGHSLRHPVPCPSKSNAKENNLYWAPGWGPRSFEKVTLPSDVATVYIRKACPTFLETCYGEKILNLIYLHRRRQKEWESGLEVEAQTDCYLLVTHVEAVRMEN